MRARWGRERESYGTFGTYWSVCVPHEKLVWNSSARARGLGRAGSGRRESDATRGATTTTREDATRVEGDDAVVEVEVDGWIRIRSFEGGDASEAPRMDECMNARARASAMDDRRRARAFAFDRRRWCAREDDEGETRRRTGEEKIFACSRVARARARRVAGSKRREIDDEDDGC